MKRRFFFPIATVAVTAAMASWCWAEPTAPADNPENKVAPESETSLKPKSEEPLVKKMPDGTYRIGKITLNKDTREISLPAFVHITELNKVLEYLLVYVHGEKIHESLFITEADPLHLNIAFKLLHYKESPELFRLLKEDGTPSQKYPKVAEELRKASRFSVHVTWQDKKEKRTALASDWIQHRITRKPMPKTAWIYHGSYIHRNKFKAKLTGNMLAIFDDQGSVASYSGEDRYDDTIWYPSKNVPAEGTKVTITLKPWK